ncbi:DJ-1 family glyoxalase III [Butyrivibrio sp. VCB2006]|uniref:DJ-1 family glyoxalase III n=1 Tax=Butyrivibrio sp. VCB2006 TaxID=1280679 RepID=UPI0004151785|nr:DJ-1 family glyoxalase III [Butyrivibrio sp. VCB2006]
MAKTAIFLADGFEEIEALTVVDLLRRAGIEITTASIMGRKEVTGSHNITVIADALIEDIDFDDIDMLILPGGQPGTTNLFNCEPLKEKIKEFDFKDKMLCAICAAPTVFGRMGLLNGKKACCYPGCEVDLNGADVQTTAVTEDGHFITSRGMGTAIEFGLAIIAHLLDGNAAANMSSKIVYK